MSRRLVVNADDFGRSAGVNRGIIRAREQGIVTSASLMVRWPAALEAAAYAAEHPELSLGLHVDLGEWVYDDGSWHQRYEVVVGEEAEDFAAEVASQLGAFRLLAGRDPTHIDSHQHVHHGEPIRGVLIGVADRLGIPLRGESPRIRHCGEFHGQTGRGERLPGGAGAAHLLAILSRLPPGATELGCHPGDGRDLDSAYSAERADEVRTLCDTRVRQALEREKIELIAFHQL